MTNHHVLRFHVAMNDARLVCGIERSQHLNSDVENLAEFELFVQAVSQCLAIDELSGQKRQSFHFTKLKHGEDVWLIQRRGDFRLLTKALHTPLVSRDLER